MKQQDSTNLKYHLVTAISILFLLHGLLWANLTNTGYTIDLKCWAWWMGSIHNTGLYNVYSSGIIEYPPIYIYLLGIWEQFFDFNDPDLASQYYKFKQIPLLFSLISGLCLSVFFHSKKRSALWSFFIVFNPALFYNWFIWGQIDIIYVCFLFLSFWAILEEKYFVGSLVFLLALNTKIQAIIFAPVVLILVWAYAEANIKKWLKIILSLLALQAVLVYPFFNGVNVNSVDEIAGMAEVITTSVDRYSKITYTAHNIWGLFIDEAYNKNDNDKLIGIFTYKQIGIVVFGIQVLLLLSSLFYFFVIGKLSSNSFKASGNNQKYIWFLLFLLGLAFFLFPTQMHERYIHASVFFAGILAILYKHWAIYLFITVFYLFNMEDYLQYAEWPPKIYSLWISGDVIGFGYCCLYLIGSWIFYQEVMKINKAVSLD